MHRNDALPQRKVEHDFIVFHGERRHAEMIAAPPAAKSPTRQPQLNCRSGIALSLIVHSGSLDADGRDGACLERQLSARPSCPLRCLQLLDFQLAFQPRVGSVVGNRGRCASEASCRARGVFGRGTCFVVAAVLGLGLHRRCPARSWSSRDRQRGQLIRRATARRGSPANDGAEYTTRREGGANTPALAGGRHH